MQNKIKKEEVEKLLGSNITESQFLEALRYAERKQAYIYRTTQRRVVLEQWYFIKLTIEYVSNLEFSRLTMDLCSAMRDMEKEHSVKDQSAQKKALFKRSLQT